MPIALSATAEAVLVASGAVLVLGGPGSGKTTLSLLKAQAAVSDLQSGQEVLFLSFSRAAVRQVEIRCRDIVPAADRRQIAVRTYHAFALDLLRAHGRLLSGVQPRVIYPGDELVAKAAHRSDWEAETLRLAMEEGRYVFSLFASAAARLLVGSRAIAEQVADKYPIVILDEFQDTDDSQWSLVQALSKRSRMIVLADPDQRIFDYDDRIDPERLNQLRDFLRPTEFDLSGENHRSPEAGILQYADAVMRDTVAGPTSDVKLIYYTGAAFDSTVHAAVVWTFSALRKAGVARPTIVVLARTNSLIGKLSTILSAQHVYAGATLEAIDHDVLWDADLTAAAALVVASILEWHRWSESEALGRTLDRIANYFEAKNATRSSASAQQSCARYRDAAERARAGRRQRLTGARTVVVAYEGGWDFVGDPARDWVTARQMLPSTNDLRGLAADAKFVRLFRATDEIGGRLASEWDQTGTYGLATDIVRRALDGNKISADQLSPRGCTLMTIHKAKGKEFDGVVLVEGQYQGTFLKPDDSVANSAATRRLLRVGITRARHQVAIVRPRGVPALTRVG